MRVATADPTQIPEPSITRFLFADSRMAIFWLVVRLYVGYEWLRAGWEKIVDPSGVWVGSKAGAAVAGFAKGALAKTGGEHPDVQGWYAWFLRELVLPNATLFSYLVAWGEVLVGIALILGVLTGIAAFFGAVMNANYLLAGAVSTNPILLIGAIGLMLAWRIAGYIGLDRYVLPLVGVPGHAGPVAERILHRHASPAVTPR